MAEKANLSQSLQADKELAVVARNQFHQNKYEDALQTLSKIKSDAKSPDPKVLHNQTVTQYYLGNCTDPKKLLEELAKIKKRIEDKLQEQEDEDEVQGVIYEDSDANIILYNTAVINYQLRQFATSLSILENLYQNIEPMDENLAIRICFLLGELYLNLKYKDKVALVVNYLEKTFPQFLSSDKKESEDDSQSSSILDITPSDFRYHLHMLKAKLFVLQKNLKSAKREIKLALGSQHPNLSNTVLLVSSHLKAYLEYQQGNYTKAIKILNSFQKSSEKHVAVMYFNNLGCIHYKMKKYHAAAAYFTRALAEGEKDVTGVTAFARSKRLQVLYNMGNKLLFTGNPELAFKCYQESSLLYYKQPKLWLRLAECCVGSHVKKLNETQRNKNIKTPLVKKVSGQNNTKRIVLPTVDSHSKGLTQEDQEINDDTLGVQFGSLSLEYGSKSIRNALFLISRIEGQSTTTVNINTNVPLSAINSSTSDEETLNLLKLSAWSTGSYIALCSNNPVVALQYAKELINYKKSTDHHKFLGSQYAATALCMLNRPNDALQYLNPTTLSESLNVLPTSPYSLNSTDPLNNGKYILLINFAIVNIMKEDLTQAQNAVSQAMNISRSTSAVLLQVYLELRKGNNEAALQLLKINNGVNFSSPKQSVNE